MLLQDLPEVTQPVERALASICRIDKLDPIYLLGDDPMEEATNICQATVGGWRLIVKKGEFEPGDLAVFFEIDSILPETAWSEFLRDRKFKIKTLKFNRMQVKTAGGFNTVISQGLALPITILPEDIQGTIKEGDNVTAVLGVTKYEPAETFKQGRIEKTFPHFIPRTDEKRIQSYMKALEEIQGKPYYITLKLDGTSMTAYYQEERLWVASRNFLKKHEEGDTYWKVADEMGLEQRLIDFPNFAIQGELVGPNIQGNRLGEKSLKLYVFNVYNISEARYLNYNEMIEFCDKTKLERVPVIEEGESFSYSFDDLEKLVGRNYPSGFPAEGIVIRSKDEQVSRYLGGRMSFKLINPVFLLKTGG